LERGRGGSGITRRGKRKKQGEGGKPAGATCEKATAAQGVGGAGLKWRARVKRVTLTKVSDKLKKNHAGQLGKGSLEVANGQSGGDLEGEVNHGKGKRRVNYELGGWKGIQIYLVGDLEMVLGTV